MEARRVGSPISSAPVQDLAGECLDLGEHPVEVLDARAGPAGLKPEWRPSLSEGRDGEVDL